RGGRGRPRGGTRRPQRDLTEGWPDPEIAKVAESIRSATGLVFSPSRRDAAARTLAQAMERGRTHSAVDFLAALGRDPRQLDELLADLTIGETYFFRQPAHFDLIRDEILPALGPAGVRPIRLWSAGC